MVFLFLSITLFFIASSVRAYNDWSVPCHNGTCSYDVINGTASGTVMIMGHPNAISDLTTAGGWILMDCDEHAMQQEIRGTCIGDDATCSHVHNGGANNTLVRMPEGCGKAPFVRIASHWVHDNQTLPDDVTAMVGKRDTPPVVHGLRLDTNFAAVDPSQNGNVTLFLQGASTPGANGNFTVTNASRRSLFGDIGDKIKDAADDVKDAAEKAVGDIENAVGDVVDDAKGLVQHTLQALSFNKTIQGSKIVDVNQPFVLFDQSVTCPGTNGVPTLKETIKINVNAVAHADVDYGVVAVGSLIPPNITNFGLFAIMDAVLSGSVNIDAQALATFSTPKLPLFNLGLPGLDFPGILTLGPSFQVNALALATISAQLNMTVDLAYNVSNAKMFFPPSAGNSTGDFSPADTGLSISASPLATEGPSLEAHIVPALVFGINALDGTVNVDVELDLDTSAKLGFTLQEGTTVGTRDDSNATSAVVSGTTSAVSSISTSSVVNTTVSATNSTAPTTSGAGDTLQGCVDVTTGFVVQVATNANFFNILTQPIKEPLFTKQFTLFKKCIGAGSSTKRRAAVPRRRHPRDLLSRRALTCPANAFTLTRIVEQTILANAIAAL